RRLISRQVLADRSQRSNQAVAQPTAHREPLRIALAQIAPTLGDRSRNLEMHKEKIAAAAEQKADLIVVPALSLTGYFLRDIVPEIAQQRDSPELADLCQSAAPA